MWALEMNPGDWRYLASVKVCRFSEVSEERNRRYRCSITLNIRACEREREREEGREPGDKASKGGWEVNKIQVNLKRLDLMMRVCTRGPASCRATVCSAAGQGANKPNPILCRISSHSPLQPLLSPLPRPFQSLKIPTSDTPRTAPPTSPPHTRHSKVRLVCCCCLLPRHRIRHPSGRPAFHQNPPNPWSFSIPTIVPRPHTVSPTPPAIRSSIVIRVPSTSTSNARAFPLLPIAFGGPRVSPQSPSPIPALYSMTPSAASHRTRELWPGKPSVLLSLLASSPAACRPASSATALGPPSIPASMRSSSPLLRDPPSNLEHLLPYTRSPPSTYSTPLATLPMRHFGIPT